MRKEKSRSALYYPIAGGAAICIWAFGSLIWSSIECNRDGRALSRTLEPYLVTSIELSNRDEDHTQPLPFQLGFVASLLSQEGLEFVDVEMPRPRHHEGTPPILDQLADVFRARGTYLSFQLGNVGNPDCIERLVNPNQVDLKFALESVPLGSCILVQAAHKSAAQVVMTRRAYSRLYPLHSHYRDAFSIHDRVAGREVLSITFGAVDPLFGPRLRCPPHDEVGRNYRDGVYGYTVPRLLHGPKHKVKDPIDFAPGGLRSPDLRRVTWSDPNVFPLPTDDYWRSIYTSGAESLARHGFLFQRVRVATENGDADLQLLVSKRDGYKHRPPKAIAEAGVAVIDVLRVEADRVMFLARSQAPSMATYLIDIRPRMSVHYLELLTPNYEDVGCSRTHSYISKVHRLANTMSVIPTFELEIVCVDGNSPAPAPGQVSARIGRGWLDYR